MPEYWHDPMRTSPFGLPHGLPRAIGSDPYTGCIQPGLPECGCTDFEPPCKGPVEKVSPIVKIA